MRELTLRGPGQLEWREAAAPRLAGSEAALVRPVAVGVCDFDRALVTGLLTTLPYPITVGHEIVAEVVEVGAAVHSVAPGELVIVPLQVCCGSCTACTSGRTNSCQSMPALSNYGLGAAGGDWGGGMCDLLSVPYADAMLVSLPAGITPADYAAVGCNLVDVYRAIAPHLGRFPEPEVLIVSGHGGTVSLYAVAMALALGARRVDVLDDDSRRLADAECLGARAVPLENKLQRQGYPIVIDASLIPDRLARGLGAVAPDGVCTTIWPYPTPVSVPLPKMFLRNATLTTGQPHARTLIGPVLDLIRAGSIGSRTIPVEILPWGSADEEFGTGATKRIFIR
jgi:alcohol dehydrogenase